MADVDARGHNGDGNGDPPPRGRNLVGGCAGSAPVQKGGRGKTKNKKLLAIWTEKGPLHIDFDFSDQRTLRPIGKYASHFKALLGVTLRETVPFTYDTWECVPKATKTVIYPQLQTYFDIGRFIGPTGVDDLLDKGINKLCATLYSNAKNRFKSTHFTELGGYDNEENIRQILPPDMEAKDWNDLVDFYIREDNMHKSLVNSKNRARHRYPTLQGSKSIAEIFHDRRNPDGTPASLIEIFKDKHVKRKKNGELTKGSAVALKEYEEMKNMKDEQEGVENPMTEDEIMDKVLKKRRGCKRGRGFIVPGYTCSTSTTVPKPSTSSGRVYTQAEVDALLKESKYDNAVVNKKLDTIQKVLAREGIEVEWEEVEEDEEEQEEREHDLNSD